jgi:hypothetical protein
MRYILFVSAIIVAAFTYASGQVRNAPLEKGQIKDLKGIIKVYVGTSSQSTSRSTTLTIIETVRKRLPQITEKQSAAARDPEPDATSPSLLTAASTTGDAGEPALSHTPNQEPERALEEGKTEDLKGVTKSM